MSLLLDELVQLRAEDGATRCRVQVFVSLEASPRPVVLLTELDDNPGLPVPAVIANLVRVVTMTRLLGVPGDPIWVEAWWGRALASVATGDNSVTTFMAVDPHVLPAVRVPMRRAVLESLVGVTLHGPP